MPPVRWWAALLALAPSAAAAGGWTQPEGGYYVKVWNRLVTGERGYFNDGDSRDLGVRFTDWSLNVYAEYGVLDWLTVVLSVTPVAYATLSRADDAQEEPRGIIAGAGPQGPVVNEADATAYVGPLGAGARFALLQGTVNLAAELRYAYAPPLGDTVIGRGSNPWRWRPWIYRPTLEAHRFDGELQLGVGLPWGFWITAHGGARYTVSDDDIPAAATAFLQAGVSLPLGFVLEAHSAAYLPFDDVELNDIAGVGNTRYIGLGFGASWWFTPHWSITAGIDGAVLAESNLAAAPILFGVEHR